jgi:hypothetical protein
MDPATKAMLESVGYIASHGVLGALVVILGVAYYKKDRQCWELAERFQNKLMEVQRETFTVVNNVTSLMEFIEKERDKEREHPRRSPR